MCSGLCVIVCVGWGRLIMLMCVFVVIWCCWIRFVWWLVFVILSWLVFWFMYFGSVIFCS